MFSYIRLFVHTILMVFVVCFVNPLKAEVVTDGSLGGATSLTGPDFAVTADLGRQHGSNLFHSISQFNVANGESASFSGPAEIANIIIRITDGQWSTIDGLIRSDIAGANIYFINPAGILFGPNGSLELSGSLHVSSADYLTLGEQNERFIATPLQGEILSAAAPTAFGFLGSSAGAIQIGGANLTLTSGKQLTLVANGIELDNASIQIDQGSIHASSIASSGEVGIETGAMSEGSLLADISFMNQSSINMDGNGGGWVLIQGGEIHFDDSVASANTQGVFAGQGIDIRATGRLSLNNGLITSTTNNNGDSGSITINTEELILNNSNINSLTTNNANAGQIAINGGELLLQNSSAISSNSQGIGDAGKIEISMNQSVEVSSGGVVESYTTGSGNAGSIFVETSELIIVGDGGVSPTGVFSQAQVTSSGSVGSIAIISDRLFLENSGAINSSLHGIGNGGLLKVVTNRIEISSGGVVEFYTTGSGNAGSIFIETSELIIDGDGGATTTGIINHAEITSSGHAGLIQVESDDLIMGNNGRITSTNKGVGDTGHVNIQIASRLRMETNSSINTNSVNGNSGDVLINADVFELNSGGVVKSHTTGSGNAGDITVQASEMSIIGDDGTSTTGIFNEPNGTGHAGNINIIGGDLIMDNSGSLASNSLGTGGNGNIGIDMSGNIVIELSTINGENVMVRENNVNIISSSINVVGDLQIDSMDVIINSSIINANNIINGNSVTILTSPITGNTELNGNTFIFSSTINGHLDILGDTVTIGASPITGNIDINGNTAILLSTFNGSTQIAGDRIELFSSTINGIGVTDIDGVEIVIETSVINGNSTINGDRVSILASPIIHSIITGATQITGATTIKSSTINGTGTTEIEGLDIVVDLSTINGDSNIRGDNVFIYSTPITGNTDISGNTFIVSSSINGNLAILGDNVTIGVSPITGNTDITGNTAILLSTLNGETHLTGDRLDIISSNLNGLGIIEVDGIDTVIDSSIINGDSQIIGTNIDILSSTIKGDTDITGNLLFDSFSYFDINVNGPLASTDYEQIRLLGSVVFDGTFRIMRNVAVNPCIDYTLIENDETDSINGDFQVTGGRLLNQTGGDGNDLTVKFNSPGVCLSPKTGSQVNEDGSTDDLTIQLGEMPIDEVQLSYTLDDSEAEIVMAPASIQPIDWNSPATIQIRGLADGINDGDQLWTLQADTTSLNDPNFDSLTDTVQVTTVNVQNTFIAGHLFEDSDGNGTQDIGEPNLSNVTVMVSDSIPSTQMLITDNNGDYIASVQLGSVTADIDENTLPVGSFQTAGIDPTTVVVEAATTKNDLDGYQIQGTILGHLFEDSNGNGVEDIGEPVLANIDIEITDSLGATNTVSSDAEGNYSLDVVIGSTEIDIVDSSLPIGAFQTTGADSSILMVTAGNTVNDLDGYQIQGTIHGHLFEDSNGNGLEDMGEPPLEGVGIEITNSLGATTTVSSDANGNYSIQLVTGTAEIDVVDSSLPLGAFQTTGIDPTTLMVTAAATVNDLDGYQIQGHVAGHLFEDSNGNGLEDVGEPVLVGVDIEITDSLGATTTVSSDAEGNYSLDVVIGSTLVDIVDASLPFGAFQIVGTDPTNLMVTAATTANKLDGYQIQGNIAGHIFEDSNGNGIEDIGEPALEGIGVEITDSLGTTRSVTSDSFGNYELSIVIGSTVIDINNNDLPSAASQTFGSDPTIVIVTAGSTIRDIDGYAILYNVAVTVEGLAAGNTIELQNNETDNLIVNSNQLTTFSTPLVDGATYEIAIVNQPTTPNQTCEFNTQNTGVIDGSDASDITLTCTTNTYFIGGSVNGLLEYNSMRIKNNKDNIETITTNGAFIFSEPIEDQEDYSVSIISQPNNPIQPCIVINKSGTIAGNDISNISISCELGEDLIFRNDFEELMTRIKKFND